MLQETLVMLCGVPALGLLWVPKSGTSPLAWLDANAPAWQPSLREDDDDMDEEEEGEDEEFEEEEEEELEEEELEEEDLDEEDEDDEDEE